MNPRPAPSPASRDATAAVPYSLQVAAALSWRLLAITGMVVVVGYVAIVLRLVVIPVALALLLTALLRPVVDWLTGHRMPRGLATLVVLVAGLALIGGLLAFVIQAFVTGLPAVTSQVSTSVQQIQVWLRHPPLGLPPVRLQNLLDSLNRSLSINSNAITSGALSTAVTLGQYLTAAALTLFTLAYFLYGGRSMWCFLLRAVPRPFRVRVDVAGQCGFAALAGFIRATALVAMADAVSIGIGLLAVGAPLVVPLAALTFLAAFIPVVGAVISGVIAVLVVLVANGPVPALILLGVVIGVHQLEGNVLQPLLMGRAVQLNGVAVVLAVAVGSVFAGIAGALLSVPLLAVLNAGIRALVGGDVEADTCPVTVTPAQRSELAQQRDQIRAELMPAAQDRPTSSARGIHHTALIASDVRRTVEFYQGLLGFPLIDMFENRDLPGSTHFFFDVGNGNTVAFFDLPGVDVGPYAEAVGGLHHLAISMEPQRWREIRDRMDAQGIEYVLESGTSIYFRDPDGARLELIADPLGEMYGRSVF